MGGGGGLGGSGGTPPVSSAVMGGGMGGRIMPAFGSGGGMFGTRGSLAGLRRSQIKRPTYAGLPSIQNVGR